MLSETDLKFSVAVGTKSAEVSDRRSAVVRRELAFEITTVMVQFR